MNDLTWDKMAINQNHDVLWESYITIMSDLILPKYLPPNVENNRLAMAMLCTSFGEPPNSPAKWRNQSLDNELIETAGIFYLEVVWQLGRVESQVDFYPPGRHLGTVRRIFILDIFQKVSNSNKDELAPSYFSSVLLVYLGWKTLPTTSSIIMTHLRFICIPYIQALIPYIYWSTYTMQ